jgi:hypothetical protein
MHLFNYPNNKSKGLAVVVTLIGLLLIFTFLPGIPKDTKHADPPTHTDLSASASSYDFNVFAIQPEADYSSWISEYGNDHSYTKVAPSNDAKASIQTQKVITGLNQFSTYAGSGGNISGKGLDLAYLLVDIPPPTSIIFS